MDAVGDNTIYGCGAFFTPAYIIKSTDAGESWDYYDLSDQALALVEILFVDEQLCHCKKQRRSVNERTAKCG